ncbi:hypothetical protein OAI08_06855 [Gammaproteobacteria bacterium]|nr:hypothetical protein [Gammaproteobacteria bacterium]
MIRRFHRCKSLPTFFFVGLLSVTADCTANEEAVQQMTLDRSDWPAVVSTSMVLANDTVRQILSSVHDEEMIRIKIRHFADSSSAQWARDVETWLVSFGIPASIIWVQTNGDEPQKLDILVGDPAAAWLDD